MSKLWPNRNHLLTSATLLFISFMAASPWLEASARQGESPTVKTGETRLGAYHGGKNWRPSATCFAPSRTRFEPGQGLRHVEEAGAASLPLPKGEGAWLVELTRSGGMLPVTETFSLNSAGELRVTRERMTGGRVTVECSRKERLPARDLPKVRAAVLSAEPSAWEKNYSDPQHPICCDQPTTRVKLSRRVAKGQAQDYTTSWYPGSYEVVATDLKALLTSIEPLWDAAHDRCTSKLRSGRR